MSSLRLSASRRISAILILPECAAAGLSRCIRRPAPAPVFSWCGYGHAEGEGSLFDDLDVALKSGSSEKRVTMLRQVTDLFLSETGDCFDFGRYAR